MEAILAYELCYACKIAERKCTISLTIFENKKVVW